MTDYRQEAIAPEIRNLILNPGGESSNLGSSYLASNGVVRTAITPSFGGPTPDTGSAVVEYEVLDNTSLSYFFAPVGPNEQVHRGGFSIPLSRTVSFRTRVRASAACWIQVQASWMTEHWVDGVAAGLSAPFQIASVGTPVQVGTAGWADLEVFVPETQIPEGATHWRPLISVFSGNPTTTPTPPPIGLSVYADSSILPDSGMDLTGIPYGDGSYPGWEWEDEPNYSSSRSIPANKPVLRNYVYDSSTADGNLAPWATYGGQASATSVIEDGEAAIRIQRTATGQVTSGIRVTGTGLAGRPGGSIVTVSALVKVPDQQTGHTLSFALENTETGNLSALDEVTDGALLTDLPGDDTWVQVFVTGMVRTDETFNALRIGRSVTTAGTDMISGEHFFVKNIMVNDGQLAVFFDGNSTDTALFTYEWTGLPYASISAMYSVVDPSDIGDEVPTTGVDDYDTVPPPESIEDIPDADPSDFPVAEEQATAPEVPDVTEDESGISHYVIKRDVADAEKVLGWRGDNRRLCLAEDVEIQGLVMNTVDAAGVVWIVSDIDGWWTTPTPDVPDVPRAWFDGSYETRGRYGARTFSLNGAFVPRSPKDVAPARDRLLRAVNLCHTGGWFMTHEDHNGVAEGRLTKGAKVWLAGQPLITTTSQSGKTEFSIPFRAPDSLKHSIKNAIPPGYNSSKLITTSSSYPERPYPKSYPWKYPDAVFGSTNALILNEGNASSWPIIRLAGPTNGPVRIFNDDTGQTMRITKKLYAGEVLEIDCFTRQVTLNGTGNFRFYLDVDVDWLMLQSGSNKIWFSEEVIGTIRTQLEILWRSSWIG